MINLTAMLRALARVWGRPCDVVTHDGAPALVLAGLDSVASVRTLRSRKAPFPVAVDQWRLVHWLRRRGAGPVWVIDRLEKVEWLLERGGLGPGHRIGSRAWPRGDLEHVVDYLLRLARQVPPADAARERAPFPDPAPRPEIVVDDAERANCRAWLDGRGWRGEPLVLLQTEARRLKRGRWPLERWRELIGAVLDRLPGGLVLLLGTSDERPRTERLAALARDPRVWNVAGELPLRRLFALLPLAHSCFSLDTGPAHAAACLGCPLVVLVGRADPRRNRPAGSGPGVELVAAWPEADWPATAQQWWDRHDIEAIPVAPVLAAWERLPATRAGSPA